MPFVGIKLVYGPFALERTFLTLETSIFAAKNEHVRLWKQTLLALETNSFSTKDERGNRVWCWGRTNSFSTRDKRV